jgi:2-polyprenyl-6-methoxyphenol hydroxylase-like FAD-dependent oxidoreductase
MTFGPNGFFAYTPYTTADVPITDRHIRGEETLPAGKSAFWWSRSAQAEPTANPDSVALKKDLEERHRSWKHPTIMKIIQNTDVALKIPTFVMPKVSTWAKGRVVLIGDAAHALPSSSGPYFPV